MEVTVQGGKAEQETSRCKEDRASVMGGDVQEQGGWCHLSPVWVPPAWRADCLRGPASPDTEYTPDTNAGLRS